MTNEDIRNAVISLVDKYGISRAVLFGSRAANSNRENSDVDIIMEFSKPVSLITLSQIQIELEFILKLDVDIIHGPITDNDIIEVNKEVVLYAA